MYKMMRLLDVCRTEKGSIISGPFGSNISSKFFVKEGIPVIRGNNLKLGMTRFIDNGFVFVTDEKAKQLNTYARKNDIIFTAAGTIGQVGIIPQDAKYSEYVISNKQLRATIDETKANPLFVFYWLSQPFMERYIENLNTGSTIPLINLSIIKALPMPVPSLEVQNKIVSLLEIFDRKIKTNEQINENLYQQVAALYGLLFGKATQQITSVGQYSEQIYSGGTPSTSKPDYWNGEFHWFSSGETRNRFVITTDKTITAAGVNNSSTKLAHKYDIVMASAGQGFTRGQTTMLLLDTYVNQSVIVIHANRTVIPYLFWNLGSRYDELRAISDSSSIRGSLTTKMIAGFEIPEVDPESLAIFSDFAWAVIPEIENNLLENERLSTLRDTLLPRLMSGELDVSTLDL